MAGFFQPLQGGRLSDDVRLFVFMARHVDITGTRFNQLTVLGRSRQNRHGSTAWECQCDCGTIVILKKKELKFPKNKSCGCDKKEFKVCAICGINKPKSDYHKRSDKPSGVQSKCIECTSEYKKKRYWGNHMEELKKMTASRTKPENIQQRKGYYKSNKGEYLNRYKKYMSDPEKKKRRSIISKEYNKKNSERISKQKKEYTQRPHVKERKRDYHHRMKSNPQYILKRRLRFRVRGAILAIANGRHRYKSTMTLLGCEIDFFKTYLESKFTDGMCWERIGEIDIDHIKPCKLFDLTKPEEQEKCFHYTNLQPLWRLDNLKKGARYVNK